MATAPIRYQFPSIFRRIVNQNNPVAKHFIQLREKKLYRSEKKQVLLQGLKAIRQWQNDGNPITSVAVSAPDDPHDESAIKFPALQVIQNPDALRGKNYYLLNIDLTRRILGTLARPGRHEIFAEIPIIDWPMPKKMDMNRLLVFDHINDAATLGHLVRNAFGLGWDAGLTTTGTTDMFNDQTIRSSRTMSLRWRHRLVKNHELQEYFDTHDMTPVVAEPMPTNPTTVWSPTHGSTDAVPEQGSGLWFWNFDGKVPHVPKRPALILSARYGGVGALDDAIRVSVPSTSDLDVIGAGNIVMFEMNRLLQKQQEEEKRVDG